MCADARNDDRDEEQYNRQNGKRSQRLASRLVVLLAQAVCDVHTDELKEEVRQSNKVDNDTDNHAYDRFATHPESGGEEQKEGDDQGRGCEDDFDCRGLLNDDEKLNREGKEEEEIELEKGDVNLAGVS